MSKDMVKSLNCKSLFCFFGIVLLISSCGSDKDDNVDSEISIRKIRVTITNECPWKYKSDQKSEEIAIAPPSSEIDGKEIKAVLQNIENESTKIDDAQNITEYIVPGNLQTDSALHFKIIFHISESNPFVRFKYELSSSANHKLTKINGEDYLDYFSFSISDQCKAKELRLSDYSHKNHCYVPRLLKLRESQFRNNDAVKEPVFIGESQDQCFLIAYENGSRYPNAFMNYELDANNQKSIRG